LKGGNSSKINGYIKKCNHKVDENTIWEKPRRGHENHVRAVIANCNGSEPPQ